MRELEVLIRGSDLWSRASQMPDRHRGSDAGVMLTDHLEAVRNRLRCLEAPEECGQYFGHLRESLEAVGLDVEELVDVLVPVALLHDIGKLDEDRESEIEHPLTGKAVPMRHPVLSVRAALELIPDDTKKRESMLGLIGVHNTPFSWYRQFERNGVVPSRKAWTKLDRRIDPAEDGTGVLLLALFKMADVHGHEDVSDVTWFVDTANTSYLLEKGKPLPVPSEADIRAPGDLPSS